MGDVVIFDSGDPEYAAAVDRLKREGVWVENAGGRVPTFLGHLADRGWVSEPIDAGPDGSVYARASKGTHSIPMYAWTEAVAWTMVLDAAIAYDHQPEYMKHIPST